MLLTKLDDVGPGPYAPCPCGSGLKARFCHRAGNRWARTPAVLKGGGGNARVEGCYARSLGDCRGPLSREHWISSSILSQMEGGFTVDGLFFLPPGESRSLPAKNLVAKVLCEGHNNDLSPLDEAAAQFFAAVLRCTELTACDSRAPGYYLFAGEDIERWALKTMLALGASAVLGSKPGLRLAVEDTSHGHEMLVRQLWGKPGSASAGLFGLVGGGARFSDRVSVVPLLEARPGRPFYSFGLIVDLGGAVFALGTSALPDPLRTHDMITGRDAEYKAVLRPIRIVFKSASRDPSVIHIAWTRHQAALSEIVVLPPRDPAP